MLELLAVLAPGVPLAALCLYERIQESRQILNAILRDERTYGAERRPR